MRLLIAIDEDRGLDSKLSQHFGHCSYFAIYETDTEKLEIIPNEIDHSNPNLTPVDQLAKYKLDMIFSLGMGQRAIELFNQKKIKIKTGDYTIVKEVIENLETLKDLDFSCVH